MRIIRAAAPRLRIKRTPQYWSLHTHSRYSVNDALPTVTDIVATAAHLGQQGVALTDHGNMAGSIELYTECMKAGIKPFPGSEFYFVPDLDYYKKQYAAKEIKAERYHLGVVAYTTQGYEHLVRLSTASHRNFFHKPTLDWSVLGQMADDGNLGGLAVTTGCHFGYLVQRLIHNGERSAEKYLYALLSMFGDSVYVELQNHHIEHTGTENGWTDESVAEALLGIADRMGLPVVLTQDSHYVEPGDRDDHEALKRLVAFGPDPDDAVFPGDGFHMVDDAWIRDHHSEHGYQRGVEGLQDLLGRHRLSIPVLDSYAYQVPAVVSDPQELMEQRCLQGEPLTAKQKRKMLEEFETIKSSGMAGYIVLVSMVTDWMREHNILFQTRGSAAGSMVCWRMGISNIDPIKWDLRFERFLSKDRTKPPDVDLDMAHDRRLELVDWLNTKFVAHQIGTWAKYSLTEEDEDEDSKGSLLVRYFSTVHKYTDAIKTWDEIPHEDRLQLLALAERHLYKGMGTNAAGVVLTSTEEEFDRLVPLAWMVRSGGNSGFITQYGKDDIEALGFVKLDVLGSKTLTVMQQAMDNLGLPVTALDEIEFGDKPTFTLISSGSTDGIFQLEGNSTKWGCKDLKPSHINDVIAAMALFRPATMNTGATKSFIRRKQRREEVPERHELLMRVTKPTHGIVLYQEQVIDLLRELGMGADDLTAFLKAVKASNSDIGHAADVIAGYQAWIQTETQRVGMNDEDQRYLADAINGFAEYGFNRAHASVYGITAYRCAYLAARHPVEFHAALLSVAAGGKKEAKYLSATRRRGVRVLRADVNYSGVGFTVDRSRGSIRRGLQSIKGVGEKTAEVIASNSPYASLDDLVHRSPPRPVSGGKGYDGTPESLSGILEKLVLSGALTSLGVTSLD